uniref:YkvA family protein n=1 Tax=Ningiella ruwaisensis TaxID=2364274 RepID=UPI00109F421B|nr:YkvA family protein [Ningiella ruwaisensis]
MALDINIELNDSDLEHFRTLMQTAVDKAKGLPAETIIERAQALCAEMENANVPDFVAKRLVSLEMLIKAIQDEDWQMPEDERLEVLTSLAYFAEPHDLVPDNIPGLGYLDDAIMIELVIRDMSLDLEAYQAFCAYRHTETNRRGEASSVDRGAWLDAKRSELRSRLRRNKSSSTRRRLFRVM